MAGPTKYQDVVTATNYALTAEDGTPFKIFLRFNGTNQWLQTNSIDFSYGDKMFVSAGVRKLSDVNVGQLIEFSSDAFAAGNSGTFALGAPGDTNQPRYGFVLKGSSTSYGNISPFTAPITNVNSVAFNIAGTTIPEEISVKSNGVAQTLTATSAPTTAGTGNFGNYPIYICARAGTSLWFNGRLYGLVVAGKQASAAEITSTETYLNQKTGAF